MTTTTGTIMMTITTIITTTMETMDEGWIAIRGIDEVIHSMAEIQPEHEEFHLQMTVLENATGKEEDKQDEVVQHLLLNESKKVYSMYY